MNNASTMEKLASSGRLIVASASLLITSSCGQLCFEVKESGRVGLLVLSSKLQP